MLRTLNSNTITLTILHIELNIHLPIHVGRTSIQSTSLDDDVVGHELQIGVQARAAGRAEEVLVDLAAVADGVVVFGGS